MTTMPIRNFCIIAHIDHGKSTLADRIIQLCGGLEAREMQDQVLDSMDLERERGITIKAQSVALDYTANDGLTYHFNLIDTPGHVDFSYEVSRSLAACEGAILLVDATQGVEAQTVAVCYMAVEQGLEIVPVLNKIDLPSADPERVKKEIENIVGIPAHDALLVSAKTGAGVKDLLELIIQRIPEPKADKNANLQALIVDSWFDNYLGVVSLVRIFSGTLRLKDSIMVHSTRQVHQVAELGVFTPKKRNLNQLEAGEVGFLVANIKDIFGAPVGDTIVAGGDFTTQALQGFKQVTPRVYAGFYPVDADDFEAFREALAKLRLNDAALVYEPERSEALGFGFRCGFLGLLHLEVVQERLEREYQLNLIVSAPTVVYELVLTNGQVEYISNPAQIPETSRIQEFREPIAAVNIITPKQYLGAVMQLVVARYGKQRDLTYMGEQVAASYWMPMNEIILNFFDRLKSLTRGYASLDYQFDHYEVGDLVKLDILIGGEKVDAFTEIVHRDKAYARGRSLVVALKEQVPSQMFEVAIQAAIGAKVIARETVKALRKNVLAKCYGGDVTRKRKLLEKQKEGKKRMKRLGKVDLPQEAFIALLKIEE